MANVDWFVFLDNVQLTRRSWQTRNRILNNGKICWIGAPIVHEGQEQTICLSRIAEDGRWKAKLCRQLRQCYSRHPFGSDLEVVLHAIEQPTAGSLADFNIALLDICTQKLGINVARFRSSTLPLRQTDRTKRLIEICTHCEADTYVSPPGSADYLAEDKFCDQSAIRLEFADYTPPPYRQIRTETFISHLSIIDVVANLGWNGTADYIVKPWHGFPTGFADPIHRQEA